MAEESYKCHKCGLDITASVIAERDQPMSVMRRTRKGLPKTWSVWVTCLCGAEVVVEGTWPNT